MSSTGHAWDLAITQCWPTCGIRIGHSLHDISSCGKGNQTITDPPPDTQFPAFDAPADQSAPIQITQDSQAGRAEVKLAADSIFVPRWVVYFQGALLGIVAATFFIFGLMVGSITTDTSIQRAVKSCRLSGEVSYQDGGKIRPDSGAVVLLLPLAANVPQRQNAELVHPRTFQPLDNPAIDMIHELGGAVVRADGFGRFQVFVDSPAQFNLLVISGHQAKRGSEEITKSQMAGMSSYFIPVEKLLGDRDFVWRTVSTSSERLEIEPICFAGR